jgi:hypothetical protein
LGSLWGTPSYVALRVAKIRPINGFFPVVLLFIFTISRGGQVITQREEDDRSSSQMMVVAKAVAEVEAEAVVEVEAVAVVTAAVATRGT